jgi:nucleoside-diphosphate-sugar epimerase
MKILITGSNGYIAKALIESLSSEHSIVCLSRAEADLTSLVELNNFFDKHPIFDAVIHTAITGGRRTKPEDGETIDQNIKMYYNLLENRNSFRRFISFGSGAELLALNTPYGISKRLIADSMKYKDKFTNIRIFGCFDHNEADNRFIKGNIIRYINKEPIQIYENKQMDFFFMEDLISLVKYCLAHENPPKEINCSYKEKHSLHQIAQIINQLGSHNVSIFSNNSSGKDYIGEFNLPISYLGLEKGIRSVYNKLSNP